MAAGTELPATKYVLGLVVLAATYYGSAKVGQTVRYTASVTAMWPPAGVGIAALYLFGVRWWPGVFLGELLVNAELLVRDPALPLGSLIGQQAGNMAEIVVGALLLRRWIGSRVAVDRAERVVGMSLAIGTATAVSATVGTLSMLLGGVIEGSGAVHFWRTWWLGDTAGALVVLPLALAWLPAPANAWRRIYTWQGAFMIAAVVGLGVLAFSIEGPVPYLVFPALLWAAFRFGLAGATLAIAIAAGVAVGFTANEVGPFSTQPIDLRTLSTQVYIVVAALTTLFLTALVTEREHSADELAEAKRHEDDRAMSERHRIARDLHDSVSQALFSTALHTRTAQKTLRRDGLTGSSLVEKSLDEIEELTRGAQREMRALIFELGHDDEVVDGLVAALRRHASMLRTRHGLDIDVHGPDRLALSAGAQTELFRIGREALANVVKHARARKAWVHVEAHSGRVLVEVRDDGSGFDTGARHPGHFGLESMHSRAAELGGVLTISSAPRRGTVVRVEARTDTEGASDGA